MRQTILDIASELMMQKGIKDTSLADIAKLANISRGTLYYYYPSKSGLVYDITEQHFNLITGNLISWINEARNNLTPEEILEVVFKTILHADTRSKLHLYLLQEAVLSDPQLMDRFREKYAEWRNMIENELEKLFAGKCTDIKTRSFIILACLDGFIIQKIVGGERLPLGDIVQHLLV